MTNRLHATIADINFEGILANASGVHCQTKEELAELLASPYVATAVTKSSTKEVRTGNPKPSYYEFEQGSINSMGLPNNGFDYYLDYVSQDHSQKPVILSVASLSMTEGIELLKRVQDSDFQGITEFNLSCPNVVGKPQVAYDFETTHQILTEVFKFFKKPLGVKLPPYFDFAHFDQMADILNQFPLSHINSVNSIGNGLYVDVETEASVIKPKKGFGGLGGAMILPTALANVRAFRERLNPDIKIIGTGGVTSGEEVFAHILCGADLVSVGTELQRQGIGLFEKLQHELLMIMNEKGYQSIDEFKGQLKTM